MSKTMRMLRLSCRMIWATLRTRLDLMRLIVLTLRDKISPSREGGPIALRLSAFLTHVTRAKIRWTFLFTSLAVPPTVAIPLVERRDHHECYGHCVCHGIASSLRFP